MVCGPGPYGKVLIVVEGASSPTGGSLLYSYDGGVTFTPNNQQVVNAVGTYDVIIMDAYGCSIIVSLDCDTFGDCPQSLYLTNIISSGIYHAWQNIISNAQIPADSVVGYKAEYGIRLDNDFTVPTNADFSAEIEGCPPFSSGQQ